MRTTVNGDLGLDRLCRALRDAAVFAASIERRQWRLDWQEVADQVEVGLVPDGDTAMLSWNFTSLGVSGGVETTWPVDLDEVFITLVGQIGDVAAEYWRVPLPACDAVHDGSACDLAAGHGGRHRAQGPSGSLRWGSRT